MIPNRATLALDAAERMAEGGDLGRLKDAAYATRNWHLLAVLRALAREANEAAKERRKRPSLNLHAPVD